MLHSSVFSGTPFREGQTSETVVCRREVFVASRMLLQVCARTRRALRVASLSSFRSRAKK